MAPSSPTHLRRPDRLEDESLLPCPDDLLQPVAIQHVGFVHPHRDIGRRLVRGRAGRLYSLLPRLPQAEREALASLVSLALEVAQKTAGLQGLLVGAVVVLAQEVEVGARPTDGAEDYQVEPLKGAAGKRGRPAKAILDGPRCIVWIYGGDLLASPVHDLGLLFGLCRHTPHGASPSLLPVLPHTQVNKALRKNGTASWVRTLSRTQVYLMC